MNIDVSGSIPAPINNGEKRPRVSKQQQNADAIMGLQQQLGGITNALHQLLNQGQQQPAPQPIPVSTPDMHPGSFIIDKLNQPQELAVPASLTADIPNMNVAIPVLPQAVPQPAYSRAEVGVQRTPGRDNCQVCNQRMRMGVVIDRAKVFIRDKTTNKAVPMGSGEETIPSGETKSWLRSHAATHFAMMNLTTGQLTWMSGPQILAKLEQKQGKGRETSAPSFLCGEKYGKHAEMDWPNYTAIGRREDTQEAANGAIARMVNHLQRIGFKVSR